MHRKILPLFSLICILLLAAPAPAARAQTTPFEPPPGYRQVAAAPGVALYRKDYPNGSPDFVQVVDLSLGAGLELLHGDLAGKGSEKGMFGGPNPKIERQTLGRFWKDFSKAHSTAFCVVNGLFFYMPDSPTRLAYPLKKDGVVVTEGFGLKDYPDHKLVLELWPGHARISPLSEAGFLTSSAPDILGGLTEFANKRAKDYTGRTFAGLDDRDQDGRMETVLILTTRTARQVDAARELRGFGADQVMMLDGGGSAMLTCQGRAYVESDRWIPQAVGVFAAPVPARAAELRSRPEWVAAVEGERAGFELRVRNMGAENWQPGALSLVTKSSPPGMEAAAVLEEGLSFSQEGRLNWESGLTPGWGVFQMYGRLTLGGQVLEGTELEWRVAALPLALKQRQDEFKARLEQWRQAAESARTPPGTEAHRDDLSWTAAGPLVEAQVMRWIEEELTRAVAHQIASSTAAAVQQPAPTPAPPLAVELGSLLWVPALMLPLAGLLLVGILRMGKRKR